MLCTIRLLSNTHKFYSIFTQTDPVADETADAQENDVRNNDVIEYDYEGTPCENNMCGEFGKCVSNYERDTYTCECFEGYTEFVEPNLRASCRRKDKN